MVVIFAISVSGCVCVSSCVCEICVMVMSTSLSQLRTVPSFAPPRRAPLQSRACPPQLYGVGKYIHIRNNPRGEDSKSLDLEINRAEGPQQPTIDSSTRGAAGDEWEHVEELEPPIPGSSSTRRATGQAAPTL